MARLRLGLLVLLALADPALAAKRRRPPPEVPAVPAPPPPSVRQGVTLWQAGDHSAAVAMWTPFAQAGDADAMFNLGQAYKLGRGVPKDAGLARDWFGKAAAKGHLPAETNLGILLFQAGEKAEAIRWLRQAADKGERRAQYVLGVAYWTGDGVPKSEALAWAYLSNSAAQGLAEGRQAFAALDGRIGAGPRTSGQALAADLADGRGVSTEVAAAPPQTVLERVANAGRAVTAFGVRLVQPDPKPAPLPTPPKGALAAVVPPPTAPAPRAEPVKQAPLPTDSLANASGSRPADGPVQTATGSMPPVPTATDAERPAESMATPTVPPPASVAPARETAAAAPARVVPKPSEWRVQIGAYTRRATAEAAWTAVKTEQKAVVGKAAPIFAVDGNITKLQLGPYPSMAAARDACARLAFSGRACFVTQS